MYIEIEQLKADANHADTFTNLLHDLTPVKKGRTYRFKESSGLSLYRHANGTWLLNNFSDKLDIPNGDIWTVTQKYFNYDTSTIEGVKNTAQIICEAAGLSFDDYVTNNTGEAYTKTAARPKREIQPLQVETWKPNYGREIKRSSSYDLLNDSAPEYMTFLNYWKRKADVHRATLERYNVQPIATTTTKTGKTIQHTGDRFAFVFKAGNNIKRKQPNSKRYKTSYVQSSGNYCFGYDQLPDKGKAVIIAAGESDTMAINDKASDTGIYAICLNSETQTPPDDLLDDLRDRFDTVTAILDNDKTGIEQAAKLNAKGIPAAHIGEAFEVNDLCDAIQANGTQSVFEWIEFIRHRQTKDSTRDAYGNLFYNDPALHHPDVFYQFKADRYVPADTICNALNYHDNLLVNAPTGTGKTTFVLQLAKHSGRRVIYAAPTNGILLQMEAAAKKAGIHTNLINGDTDEPSYEAHVDAPLFISTYDSLKKVSIDISECILVIDEQHLSVSEHAYRPKALNDVLDHSVFAAQTVFLSATPDYFLAKVTGCTVLKFNVLERPKMKVQPLAYTTGNETGAAKWIHEQYPTGKHIIKKDNTAQLQAMAETIKDRSTLIISNKVNIKQSDKYERIIDGHIDAAIILTTKLLELGISILDQIDTVNFLNPRDPNEIIQTAARPRMNNGKNKVMAVNLFFKGDAPDMAKDHEYTPVPDNVDAFIQRAQYFADAANKDTTGEPMDNVAAKHLRIRYSVLHTEYVPDMLAIIYEYRERVKAVSTKADLYARLQAAGAEILPVKYIELDTIKGEKKTDYKAEAAHIFAHETSSALGSVKYHTRSKELRDKLKHVQARNDDRAKELKDNKVLYRYLRKFAHRFIEIKDLSGCSREAAVQLVSKHTSKAKYKAIRLKAEAIHVRKSDANAGSKIYARILDQTETAIMDAWTDQSQPFEISKYKAWQILSSTPAYKNAPAAPITRREMSNIFMALFEVKDNKNSYRFSQTAFFRSKNENPIKSTFQAGKFSQTASRDYIHINNIHEKICEIDA